jgi:hypothetical protein
VRGSLSPTFVGERKDTNMRRTAPSNSAARNAIVPAIKNICRRGTRRMKFQLAINLERLDESLDMRDVARHTLEMVQMAEDGGFHIAWSAEHHALEMTIAPGPLPDPHLVGLPHLEDQARHRRGGGALLAPHQARGRSGLHRSRDRRPPRIRHRLRRLPARVRPHAPRPQADRRLEIHAGDAARRSGPLEGRLCA